MLGKMSKLYFDIINNRLLKVKPLICAYIMSTLVFILFPVQINVILRYKGCIARKFLCHR